MSEAKFTKGDWVAIAPSERHIMECGTDITTYEVNCNDRSVYGSVFLDSHGYDLEEAVANAYLIAAAPEMYKEIWREYSALLWEIQNFICEDEAGEKKLRKLKVAADRKAKILAKARGDRDD